MASMRGRFDPAHPKGVRVPKPARLAAGRRVPVPWAAPAPVRRHCPRCFSAGLRITNCRSPQYRDATCLECGWHGYYHATCPPWEIADEARHIAGRRLRAATKG